jgi:hypothetical protein
MCMHGTCTIRFVRVCVHRAPAPKDQSDTIMMLLFDDMSRSSFENTYTALAYLASVSGTSLGLSRCCSSKGMRNRSSSCRAMSLQNVLTLHRCQRMSSTQTCECRPEAQMCLL